MFRRRCSRRSVAVGRVSIMILESRRQQQECCRISHVRPGPNFTSARFVAQPGRIPVSQERLPPWKHYALNLAVVPLSLDLDLVVRYGWSNRCLTLLGPSVDFAFCFHVRCSSTLMSSTILSMGETIPFFRPTTSCGISRPLRLRVT